MKARAAVLRLLLAALLLLSALTGCSRADIWPDAAARAPAPSVPVFVPTPTPSPFPEPITEPGGPVYFAGQALESGRQRCRGVEYVKLSEAAAALGAELTRDDGGGFSFPWRKSAVRLLADCAEARYLEEDRTLSAPPLLCAGGADLLVPVEDFCAAAEIGYFYDEEQDTVYCTPASGGWALPEGYVVPVLMYHEIGHAPEEANLFVDPEALEQQFQFLTENGFTPIWFEDLWHVEDFEKPVILIFDDGYKSMYTRLLPLAEKYEVKAVVAIVQKFTREGPEGMHLSRSEVLALQESGWISLQSHGVTHRNLAETWLGDPEPELRDSALWLTRLLRQQPIAFIYPIGGSTPQVQELVAQYYRFGVKMGGPVYRTGDEPTLIYRFFVERHTPLQGYANWLNGAFAEEGA